MPEHPDRIETSYRSGVRWSLAGSAGSAIFQFLQMVVFARFASPAEAGDYALAAAVIGFLTPVAEAGVSQAIVYSHENKPEHLASLMWVNMGLGLLLFLLLYLSGDAIAGWYGRPALTGLLMLMGTTLLFTALSAQSTGLLTRAMQFDAAAKIEIFSWAISSSVVCVLAWQGWGAWSMGAGFLLRNILATTGALWVARQQISIKPFKISALNTVKSDIKFGLFDLSSRWADFLANYLDKLIIGKWLGAAALGYYNLAFTFLMLPTARLGHVISRVSYPVFARVRDNASQLQRHFQKAGREVVTLLFPVYTGIVLFPHEILLAIFGKVWLPAAPLLVAFGLAGLVRACCTTLPQLTRGVGKPHLLFVWMLAWTLVLNIFLTAFLMNHASVESAAWSRTAAKFICEIAMLRWLAARCGVRLDATLVFAAKTLFWLAPVAAITWLAGRIPGNFLTIFAAKAAVFVAGMLWFALKSPLREDVADLRRLFGLERKP